MPNHLKMCSHPACRRGRKKRVSCVTKAIRAFRYAAKRDLKKGREPIPKCSVGHTD